MCSLTFCKERISIETGNSKKIQKIQMGILKPNLRNRWDIVENLKISQKKILGLKDRKLM